MVETHKRSHECSYENENEKNVFYYNEYGVLDLNSIINKDVPFTI